MTVNRTWFRLLSILVISAMSFAADRPHWSLQPIQQARPADTGPTQRNAIDAFIDAGLRREQIDPSPEANRITRIRRTTLDLIGLPPTPEAVAEFLSDRRPNADIRLIDRLLASPHYGERWARPWLDCAITRTPTAT